MLCGCFFSTPNSKFYLLESQNDTNEVISLKKVNIAVQDVILPDYLQKPQIVLQPQNSSELKISEFNRWASDLEEMFQNTLIEDLQKTMPNATIKPLTYGSKAGYVIKINIEKLSGYFKEKAYLKGTYQILSSSGKLVQQKNFDLSTNVRETYASYVAAQSNLISLLATDITFYFK